MTLILLPLLWFNFTLASNIENQSNYHTQSIVYSNVIANNTSEYSNNTELVITGDNQIILSSDKKISHKLLTFYETNHRIISFLIVICVTVVSSAISIIISIAKFQQSCILHILKI